MRSVQVWRIICQDSLLCVYHAYTERASLALCDVYLEVLVPLGSEIFILWMVLSALSCWKDPWTHWTSTEEKFYIYLGSWVYFQLDFYLKWWYCSGYRLRYSDGDLFKNDFTFWFSIPLPAWLGDEKVTVNNFTSSWLLRTVAEDQMITVIVTASFISFFLAVLSQFKQRKSKDIVRVQAIVQESNNWANPQLDLAACSVGRQLFTLLAAIKN